ncbi:hypothetical protein KZ829_08230 [Actinoplanes hulinensis]|uniref:Uncharacterized protein n=1 Tax=Actinoplanes hulinensis TaxID=1144547 RepID=A0ABS7AYU7_9ACTN|nr:hypothetical protein [Actinoplanes hulinensis]MBW6433729.1 hypothetical protein [Actinoplanes hulinensis]
MVTLGRALMSLARGPYRLDGSVLTHPGRGDAGARTAAQAPPGLLRIVSDPQPDGPPTVLRTAISAWGTVPEDSTHHLVLQDDMLLAEGAWERILDAIEAAPDAALALFAIWDSRTGAMVRLGALTGANWVPAVGEYIPCAALVLPRDTAIGYARMARDHAAEGWPDDILMQRHLRAAGIRCLVSAPNLAEHLDGPSIVGNAFRGPRRSACFLSVAPDEPPRIMRNPPPLVPFLKNGVAQCLERSPDGDWLHLETGARLRLLGAPEARLRAAADHDVRLTAYALGLLSRGGPSSGPVVAEALRTIGPGGASQRGGDELDEPTVRRLAEHAARAVEAGRGDPLHPPPARRRIALRPGDRPLTAHLAAYLAESDTAVTIADDGADPRAVDGDLYGPGCGPDGLIGSLVWQALRSRPILLTDAHPALVRPLHVRELAGDLTREATAKRPPAYPLREFALAVAEAVRPVPVRDLRPAPAAHGTSTVSPEIRFRLHHYAQWLAYEWFGGAATVSSTTAAEPSAR